MAQQPGSAWDGVPVEQQVTTSTVLWGDVVQSVDPDSGERPVVYTFGGRIEFREPEWVAPVVRPDGLLGENGLHLITEAGVRLSLE